MASPDRERICDFGRGGACGKLDTPELGAEAWRPHRNSFRRGTEARHKTQQGSGACMYVQQLCQWRTWKDRVIAEGNLRPNLAWLVNRELYRVDSLGLSLLQENFMLGTGWPGAECPRFAVVRLVSSQTNDPNFHLQISEARLRSPLWGTVPQGKEEKALKGPLPDNKSYTVA